MPMFFMPTIGQQLLLKEDWTFILHPERRNDSLYEALVRPRTEQEKYRMFYEQTRVTIPSNSVLTIDRIYLRRGGGNWDSITFNLVDSPDTRLRKGRIRFWAKLPEVNGIEVEFVEGYKKGKFPREGKLAATDADGAVQMSSKELEDILG